MRVEPLHQLFSNWSVIKASLGKVKDDKERETSVQCPVMISIVLKGLRPVHRFLARGQRTHVTAEGDTYGSLRPTLHDELDIIESMLNQHGRYLFAAPSKTPLTSGLQ